VGASTPQGMTLPQLLQLIRGSGKQPAERDSFYRVIREFAPDDSGEGITAPADALTASAS
jgi:aminodeoxyfutalosine synthase